MPFLVAAGGHRKELKQSGDLVGSAEYADVRVSPELDVAAEHYRVGLTPTGWQIQPLAPTTVNGTPIDALTPLAPGDQIAAGSLMLEFASTEEVAQVAPAIASLAEPEAEAPTVVDPLAAAIANTSKQDKKKRGIKLPKFAVPAAAVLLLSGGAFAAWKSGVLPFGKTEDVPTGVIAKLAAVDPHYDLLSKYAPTGSDFALSLDIQAVGKFYDHWRAKLAPEMPALAEASEQMVAQTGLRFEQIERISVIGSSQTVAETGTPESVVALLTLAPGTNAVALLENPQLNPVKTEGPGGVDLYQSELDERIAARVLDKRHVLLASPSGHLKLGRSTAKNPHVVALQRSRKTLAVSGTIPTDQLAQMAGENVLPTNFDIGIDLPAGIDLAVGLSFANEADAKKAGEDLKSLVEMAGGMATQEGGDMGTYAQALLARVEMKQSGKKQTIGLRFTEGELAMMANKAKDDMPDSSVLSNPKLAALASGLLNKGKTRAPAVPASTPSTNAKRLVITFAQAKAAASPDIADCKDLESAVKKIQNGVKGLKQEGFDSFLFQAAMSDDELIQAMEHLSWNPETLSLSYKQ